jgi:hypothetical protein
MTDNTSARALARELSLRGIRV